MNGLFDPHTTQIIDMLTPYLVVILTAIIGLFGWLAKRFIDRTLDAQLNLIEEVRALKEVTSIRNDYNDKDHTVITDRLNSHAAQLKEHDRTLIQHDEFIKQLRDGNL